MEYIEREAFLAGQQHLYCGNCARRKNSKGKFVYDIGDAPCRACSICDVLDAVEDFPAADVRPVGLLEKVEWERDIALAQLAEIGKSFGEKMDDVRPVVLCRDCIFRSNEWTGCPKLNGTITGDEFFCKCGIKREES